MAMNREINSFGGRRFWITPHNAQSGDRNQTETDQMQGRCLIFWTISLAPSSLFVFIYYSAGIETRASPVVR